MLSSKGCTSTVRASWTKRTLSSQKENLVLKGILLPERVFVAQKGILGPKGNYTLKGQYRSERVWPERVL